MSYILPQTQVFQDVRQAPTATVMNLNPLAYGAHYSLRRYSEASEKALISMGAYSPSAGITGAYPNKLANSTVDQNYVKIFADDAWLNYKSIAKDVLNPVMLTDNDVRNKLRAAPRIVEAGQNSDVTMATAGYHLGTIGLPEAYYFYPTAAFTLGTDLGAFAYETNEGLTGYMVIPTNASDAGVKVQGPDGLVMDFGTGNRVQSPRVVTFKKAASANLFTLTIKADRFQNIIDRDLNSTAHAGQIKIDITKDSINPVSVAYDGIDFLIEYGVATTLTQVRDAILNSADYATIALDFDLSAITGVGTDDVITAEDQDGNAMDTGSGIAVFPDCYRVNVFENTWIFKTANGISRSASLCKDVEVGDKIKWTVTPASTGLAITGWSTVAGLLPDYTRATLADAQEDAGNTATEAGDNISGAGAALMTAGADNQNTAFNMGTSVVKAISGNFMTTDLVSGVLSEDILITVTKQGTVSLGDKPEVTVENASGTYRRENVLIEATSEKGQIYVGNNVYVTFVSAGDEKFYAGDTYTISASSAFTKVSNESVSGTYVGTSDTTYQVEVTRGGVFTRTAAVLAGLTTRSGVTLVANITGWTAGDVNDEYILECTQSGSLAAATFELSSQRGDNVASLGFIGWGAGNAIEAGASGMTLSFTDGGGTPDFVAGQYFIIQVKASRPKIRITDSAGIDQQTAVVVVDGTPVNLGLNGARITFPSNVNAGLITGDIFTVAATAEAPVATQTIVLADELPASIMGGGTLGATNYAPDTFAIDLALIKASKEIPKINEDPGVAEGTFNWSTSASAITLAPVIKLQDASYVNDMGVMPYLELVHGNIYSQYRSLLQEYTDAIYSITDINSIATELGPEVEDNPLALAVKCMLENIGRGTCYFTAIPTDDAAGDAAALSKASLTNMT